MNNYEALLDEAYKKGLIVKEKPLQSSDGRIKDNKIAIRKDLFASKERACVLSEEIGHYHTSTGNILDQSDVSNRKQEYRARLWAYNKLIGLRGLVDAYVQGCQNWYEVAEYLEVTYEYLQECIECYKEKYGAGIVVDNYYIMFIPYFGVGQIVK